MVFYYSDLQISNSISDWLILSLLLITYLMPIMIYKQQYQYAWYGSLILASIQLMAVLKNINRKPL